MFQIRSEQFAAMRRKKIGDTLIDRLSPFVGASWDAQSQHILLRNELGSRGTLSFDAHGFVGAYTSPLGRTWQLTNQDDGQLLRLVSPSAHTLSMAYTAEGLVAAFATTTQARINLFYERQQYIASQYIDGTTETVEYTAAGDPAMLSSRLGTQVRCTYDDYRRLTSLTDGNGHRTQFSYNRWNRPEEVLYPNGQREVFGFDEEGRLYRVVWSTSETADILSDSQGRPLQLAYSDGLETEFAYNDQGMLIQASCADQHRRFCYNDDGQFTEEIAGSSKHTFAYDLGRRLASVTSLGATATFRYDADNRLTGFTDWLGGEHLIEYLPGDRGQVMTGPSISGAAGVRSFLRTDTAGRLASLQVVASGNTCFSSEYSYDLEGRLSTTADSVFGQRTFSYDADSRLVYADASRAESREAFAYDAAGNLAVIDATRLVYDSANQLLEAGKEVLHWDGRGNLLLIEGPEGTTRFRYNLRNQLVHSTADDGTQTQYSYDALGRRTAKRTGNSETRFFWAGEQMLCEIQADLATGQLRRQDFLYHPETGIPIATAIDGEVFTIHTDHLGTPRAAISARGEVVWLAEISSYGVARVTTDRISMPLRFRGQYYDSETGLHYNRFRYYAPKWGRYISRDPLTFAAGTNHYLYASANPINRTDALGLISWNGVTALAFGAAAGIAVGIVLAPIALPLAIIAGGIVAGAVAGGFNEALNEKEFCLKCIARAAGLGALAGAAGALPFLALPVGAGLLAFMGAGALGGALSYGVNCLDGAEKNPSWGGLATSVAMGGVFGGIGKGIGELGGPSSAESSAPDAPVSEASPEPQDVGEPANDNVPAPSEEPAGPGEPANDNVAPPGKAANDNNVVGESEPASDGVPSTDEAANDNVASTSRAPIKPVYKPGYDENYPLSFDKGSRPDPSTYLDSDYMDQHLQGFKDDGGGFLFTSDDIANPDYTGFNPKKFVMNGADVKGIVSQYQATGDLSVLESGLGYDPGSLAGKDIYMMQLDNPDVSMPTGNEGGATSLWKPGGLTDPGGMREAVLNNVSITHNNDINYLMSTQNVTKLP